jgi:hypothetical protein
MTDIFESPDRGETVYRRHFGQTERELYSVADSKKQQERRAIWHKVLLAAEHNPDLQETLDRAQVIYELSRDD